MNTADAKSLTASILRFLSGCIGTGLMFYAAKTGADSWVSPLFDVGAAMAAGGFGFQIGDWLHVGQRLASVTTSSPNQTTGTGQ
jgi:hypothetical protein